MGRIKSRLIKRTARELIEKGVNFKNDFEYNKSLLKNIFPSKKIRNQVAGLITRLKRQEQETLNKTQGV